MSMAIIFALHISFHNFPTDNNVNNKKQKREGFMCIHEFVNSIYSL